MNTNQTSRSVEDLLRLADAAETRADRAFTKMNRLRRDARDLARIAEESEAFALRVFPGGAEAARLRAVECRARATAAAEAALAATAAHDKADEASDRAAKRYQDAKARA